MLKHIIAITMIVATILACAVAQARPQFQVVNVGCKLMMQPNQETYVPENGTLMVGGGCNE